MDESIQKNRLLKSPPRIAVNIVRFFGSYIPFLRFSNQPLMLSRASVPIVRYLGDKGFVLVPPPASATVVPLSTEP
jgi:hypothetical protein